MILYTRTKILACPRPRASKGGHVFMPKNYKDMKKQLVEEFKAQPQRQEPFTGPLSVHIAFMTPTKRVADLDNYVKSILDALEDARIFIDDIQVCQLSAEHYIGDSMLTTIEIHPSPDHIRNHYSDKVTKKIEKEKKNEIIK